MELRRKRSMLWVVLAVVVVCVIAAVCLLSNSKSASFLRVDAEETEYKNAAAEGNAVAYEAAVSWVNYAEDASELYRSALNSETMTSSSVRHLPIFRCGSTDELEAFRSDFSDVLDFSARYDEIESFDEIAQTYDREFFEENTLLLVYVTAGSGSYRYGVDHVAAEAERIVVHTRQVNAIEVGSCDMAGWLIWVSLSNEDVGERTVFDADLLR